MGARAVVFRGFVGYLVITLVVYLSPVPFAYANPVLQNPAPNGGSNIASAGSATVNTSGNTETITQTTGNAVIDWSSFNIGGKEKTQFVDPNSSSLTVNRVHDMNPSQILGTLSANGNIVLINPNGVLFGQGSTVDVNGIVATTSNVSNANVMNGGKLNFTPGGNPSAGIVNQGSITAANAGLVGLVAPNVTNSGIITAKLGTVHLASGDSFTLDLYGDGLLEIGVSDAVNQQLVENTGTINAAGGTINLTAAAGRQIVNSLIDVEGELHAPAVAEKGGTIFIYGEGSNAVPGNVAANKGLKSGSSTVTVSGYLDASGYGTGQTGGNINVLGDNVAILSGAKLNASGPTAGGKIEIGGDFHGAGTTPTALTTTVQQGATLNANATDSGNGGNVAVWSDNYTNFLGLITASGGPNSGNGGFVETSGHELLSLTNAKGNTGSVDASAPKGTPGTWLLDPADVTICSTTGNCPNGVVADNGVQGSPSYTPTGSVAESQILASEIVTALNAGTNVSITTGGDSASGTNGGTITVSSAISATTGTLVSGSYITGSLTLSSYKDIIVNSAITLGGTNTGPGGVPVTGGALTLDAANSGNSIGAITISANIATNGGTITMGGGANPSTTPATGDASYSSGINNGGTLNAGGGNISLLGTGYLGANNITTTGLYLVGATVETTGSGTITMTGTGGTIAVGGNAEGIYLNGTPVSTVNGNISITSTAGNSGSYGLRMDSGNHIFTTGSGNITVIAADTGSAHGITGAGTATAFGGASDTGAITFNADSFSFVNTPTVQTTGNVTFAPYSTNTSIGVAGGGGTLQITIGAGSILTNTTAGSITIGAIGDTNLMTVDANTWTTPLSLVSGTGVIKIAGAQAMGSNSFTMETNATPTLSSTVTTTGNITIETAGNSLGLGTGSGTVSLTDTALGQLSYGSLTLGDTVNTGNIDFNDSGRTFTKPLSILSSGNITLDSQLNSSAVGGSGPVVVLASGGNFINNYTVSSNPANPINLTGSSSPAWAVYSTSAASDTNGASVMNPTTTTNSKTYTSDPPSGLAAGTNWIYSSSTTPESITFTATGQTITYGGAPNTTPTLNTTYTCSGSGCADIASTSGGTITISGTLNSTSTYYTANTSHTITLSGVGITWDSGYSSGTISYNTGALTVNAKGISITGFTASNKQYDTTNTATISSNGSITSGGGANQYMTGDTVSINSGGASATFANANVGSSKTVTATGYALSGADASNYTLTQPTTAANITAAPLTVTSTAGQTVVYGSNIGTLTYNESGLLGSDSLTGALTTAQGGAGTAATHANGLDVGNYAITQGTLANSNYTITYNSANLGVTPLAITVASGVTGTNKVYDTTTGDTLTFSSPSLTGVVGSDAVSINQSTGIGTFANANVGTNKAVTVTGLALTGAQAADYTLTQPTGLTANITAAGLTVTASNVSGTYGTSAANTLNSSTGFTSSGLLGGQTIGSVTLATNATSSTSNNYNANTGSNPASWTITATNATGGSFNPSNYQITYDTGTQTITPASLTISGMTANNKVYDNTTAATVNNSADTMNGVVAGLNNGGGTSDVVTLGGTSGTSGTFSSANTGTWTVTGSGLSISGADAGNYTLSQPTATATISNLASSSGGRGGHLILPGPVTQPAPAPVVVTPVPPAPVAALLPLPNTVVGVVSVNPSITYTSNTASDGGGTVQSGAPSAMNPGGNLELQTAQQAIASGGDQVVIGTPNNVNVPPDANSAPSVGAPATAPTKKDDGQTSITPDPPTIYAGSSVIESDPANDNTAMMKYDPANDNITPGPPTIFERSSVREFDPTNDNAAMMKYDPANDNSGSIESVSVANNKLAPVAEDKKKARRESLRRLQQRLTRTFRGMRSNGQISNRLASRLDNA
jgi:filamentous hemagglutinin family protein